MMLHDIDDYRVEGGCGVCGALTRYFGSPLWEFFFWEECDVTKKQESSEERRIEKKKSKGEYNHTQPPSEQSRVVFLLLRDNSLLANQPRTWVWIITALVFSRSVARS